MIASIQACVHATLQAKTYHARVQRPLVLFLQWLPSISAALTFLVLSCRPLAKDGVNRSFAAVYEGEHSPDAAKDAADRLHLILQREDALVAKNSGECHSIHSCLSGGAWHMCLACKSGCLHH